MTCSEQEEDLAPDEASGVLCRCGHLLTDTDLHFCGYCGSVIQVTRGRRQAPAAVVSGRRAALAALASERNAVPVDPVTDRFVAPPVRALHPLPPPPAAPAPPVTVLAAPAPAVAEPPAPAPAAPVPAAPAPVAPAPVVPVASAALAAATLAEAAESALAAAPAAPVASATRTARAARASRTTTRANRPARVARGVAAGAGGGTATTSSAPESTAVPAAPASAPAPTSAPEPERETDASSPSPAITPVSAASVATAPPANPSATEVPAPSDHATPPPVDEADEADEADEPDESEPRSSVLGRRSWPAWLGVGVIVGACAVRTALGLLFTYPGYLSWLPVVLVAVVALLKVARFSIGLVGVATAAAAAWWVVDHVVSTARLQSLGYDAGQTTITVPGLVAAIGSVPLAAVLCALVDGHVRTTVRAWVVPRGGPSPVRAAAVVLALLAALFPVAGSLSTGPGFATLTAAGDQVRYPGYPTPAEIADRMHAMSVSKGRPVSMTCTYAPDDGAARPTYQCVGISQVGSEAAQVHDGIRSTALPDGTYSCVDLTSGVDRRLC